MKNIQIIDGAANATIGLFQVSEGAIDAIFPNGQDIEFIEDFIERVGEGSAAAILQPVWAHRVLKREAQGIHGTLFYNWGDRRHHSPASKREVDMEERAINEAQRLPFRSRR